LLVNYFVVMILKLGYKAWLFYFWGSAWSIEKWWFGSIRSITVIFLVLHLYLVRWPNWNMCVVSRSSINQ
jgi:hypothetical protein